MIRILVVLLALGALALPPGPAFAGSPVTALSDPGAPRLAQSDVKARTIRAVQRALNFFDFDAGTIDGVYGPNTRAAIERFQAYLGWRVTGYTPAWQIKFLLAAYREARQGGPQVSAAMNSRGGIRNLLLDWRDRLMEQAAERT